MFTYKNLKYNQPEIPEITKFRFYAGILSGLFYSFVFYGFLVMLREGFRIMSITQTNDIWVLTDSQVHLYNFISALLALIFGQSVTFGFWVDRPRKPFERRHYRRTAIVNDQRFLNWYFIQWFFRIMTGFAFMLLISCNGYFYAFGSAKPAIVLLFLILTVLFLQTWTWIRFTFKRKSLKWMSISMLIMLVLAFAFSRISFIDYNAINKTVLDKNIQFKYGIEYPEAQHYEYSYWPSLTEHLYIAAKSSDRNDSGAIIIADGKELALNELGLKINEWKEERDTFDLRLLTISLHIDKSVKMGFVNKVKTILKKSGIDKIAYAVVPAHAEYDKRYYQELVFPMYLRPKVNTIESVEDCFGFYKYFERSKIIILSNGSRNMINGKEIKLSDLKNRTIEQIQNSPKSVLFFVVDDRMNFEDYFKVVEVLFSAIYQLNNGLSNDYISVPAGFHSTDNDLVVNQFSALYVEVTYQCYVSLMHVNN